MSILGKIFLERGANLESRAAHTRPKKYPNAPGTWTNQTVIRSCYKPANIYITQCLVWLNKCCWKSLVASILYAVNRLSAILRGFWFTPSLHRIAWRFDFRFCSKQCRFTPSTVQLQSSLRITSRRRSCLSCSWLLSLRNWESEKFICVPFAYTPSPLFESLEQAAPCGNFLFPHVEQ